MVLEHDKIRILLEEVKKSDSKTFSSILKQIFEFIERDKQNVKYLEYEKGRQEWQFWLKNQHVSNSWKLPDNYNDAKALSYFLYKNAAKENENGTKTVRYLFSEDKYKDKIHQFNKVFLLYFCVVVDEILKYEKKVNIKSSLVDEPSKVFLIHGHDINLLREVQLLLNRANIKVIVLAECSDMGRVIIDKLIEEGKGAEYAIALLSPDDLMKDYSIRARQNVILEIGYFLGKLGKEKVRMLKKGNVEIPSDLKGILYTDYNNSGWQLNILKEMQAVGLKIDLNNVIKYF